MNVEALNGRNPDPDPAVLSLTEAQVALRDAAMGLGMSLEGAALSAYINGLLQSARISAVCKWLIGTRPDLEAELTALTVEAITGDIIPKLKAQQAPAIITSTRRQ